MVKKEMKTEEVGNLKYLLFEELHRLCDSANLDAALFMGVDARVFSSYIPTTLSGKTAHFFQLIRNNLDYICGQLRNENLQLSVQKYQEGVLFISGIGRNAFVAALSTRDLDLDHMVPTIKAIERSSMVIRHLFELKPLTEVAIVNYPEDVAEELRKLGRILFKERYTYTKEYQKNMEIYEYIKKKLTPVLGKGEVEQILTITFNEMGTQPSAMTRHLWLILVERIIKEHIAPREGEIAAEEYLKAWLPEIEQKLKSIV